MYAAYTFLKMGGDTDSTEPNSAGEDSPENQLSLRSNMSLGNSSMLDLWLRYVGELEKQQVDAYVALDARLAWQATDSIRLSLIGRNLLDSSHLEFHEEFGSNQAIEIKREALAELVWQF
jgi:outer membrane receptor for monomeric catechols